MKTVGFHEDSATILNFMAIIQSTIPKNVGTFGQLLDNLNSSVYSAFQDSNIILLVPDKYDVKHSIKSAERSRRHQCVGQKVFISSVDQNMPKSVSSILVIQIINQIFKNSSSKLGSFNSIDLCKTTKSYLLCK